MSIEDIGGGEGAAPALDALVTDHVEQMFDVKHLSKIEQIIANGVQIAITNAIGGIIAAAGGVGMLVAKAIEGGEQIAAPLLAPTMATMIQSAFGIEVDESSLRRIRDATARNDLGRAMGATVLGALHSEGGEIQPGQAPAEKLIGMLAHLAMDSWAEGTILEWIISLSGMLHELEGLTKLAPAVVQATGLDELGRIGLRPLANVTVATPLTWAANKQYRPNLLSEGEILKAFNRGDYSGDDAQEELARLGYSPRRQEMLVKSAAKRLSLEDTLLLVRDGLLGRDYAIQNLRDEGFDQTTAEFAVVAAEVRRFNSFNDNSLSTIARAFVNREISEGALTTFLQSIIRDDNERASFVTAAQTERELNVRHLSGGEVIDCCKLGILPTAYYRAWLAREGYPTDEAFALELRLRMEIDRETKLEDQRAKLQAERDAEKQQRADDAAARKAAVDAERALHRRGSLADLNRAAVRGLIPFARVAEVLAAQYDADTVGVMLALLEDDRQAYLEQQARAEDVRQRAGRRNLDVGAIEAAVLAGVLTFPEFAQRLQQLGFLAADVAVLSATLADRKRDLDDARAKQAAAAAAAKIKKIDLGRFEQLVRRGVRTIADYAALLISLGFDDGSRAAMIDLLKLHIADDAAAEAERKKAANVRNVQGVTLELLRRAVILGHASEDDFQRFLVDQHFTSDAQALLLAELRDDVTTAEDARRRRDEAAARVGARALSLDRVARAVRLGIVSPAAYRDRLVRDGYTEDDIAIELALLVQEIADVQATRAKQAAAEQAATDRGLSLADVARAVKAGAATIDDYYARAATLGYSPADAGVLVAVLNDELAAIADANSRHTSIDGELTARTLSLGQLEAAVKAGAVSIEGYMQQLESWGYGADDAELLAGLLVDQAGHTP